MKKILLSAAMLAAVAPLHAQNANPLSEAARAQMRNRIFSNLFAAQPGSHTAKPTALQQRVTGIKLYNNIGTSMPSEDTTMLFYSGLRGSQFNYSTLQYHTDMHTFNEPLAEALWIMPATAEEVNADSVITQMTGFTSHYLVDYEQGNLKQRIEHRQTNNTTSIVTVDRDNSNHITQINYTSDQTPTGIRKLTYNAGFSRILTDTTFPTNELVDFLVWNYTYYPNDQIKELAAIGYLASGDVVNNSRYTFTYTPDNRIETVKEYLGFDGVTGWDPMRYDSFTYEGNNPIFKGQYVTEFTWQGGEGLSYHEIKQFNANGLPDTVRFYAANPQLPDFVSMLSYTAIAYNAFDNPVSKLTYETDATEPFRIYRYYYQNYETSVTELSDEQLQLNLYPNPVSNHFRIAWPGKDPVKQAVVSIVNMEGKVMQRMNTGLKTGNNVYDASGLAPGNYLIVVEDEKGKRLTKQFVKQ